MRLQLIESILVLILCHSLQANVKSTFEYPLNVHCDHPLQNAMSADAPEVDVTAEPEFVRLRNKLAELGPEDDEESDESEVELALDPNNRPSFGGSMDFDFSTFSKAVEFVSDEQREKLIEDCARTMTARARGIGLSEGMTYMVRACDKPRCTLEEIALKIFEFHTANADFDPSKSGAEWWTQVIDAEDDIGFHFDKDFALENFELNVHPHLGTVTYLNNSFVGAPTIVINKRCDDQFGEQFTGPASKASISFPQPGKHMSFDGRMLHGAPSNLRVDVPHRDINDLDEEEDDDESEEGDSVARDIVAKADGVQPNTAGGGGGGGAKSSKKPRQPRVTFLVNIWLNHIPLSAASLPEQVLQTLTCGRKTKMEGLNVNLVPGKTEKNPTPVLGAECKKVQRNKKTAAVASGGGGAKGGPDSGKKKRKPGEVDAEAGTPEPGVDEEDDDYESVWEFASDEWHCELFAHVAVEEICRQQHAKGRESFTIDLGELPDVNPYGDMESEEDIAKLSVMAERTLFYVVCIEEEDSEDLPIDPDELDDENSEDDTSDEAPALPQAEVEDLFAGSPTWDGDGGDTVAPFAHL